MQVGDGAGLGRLTPEQMVDDVIASHELADFTVDYADRQRLLAIAEGRLSADDAVAAIIREATSTTIVLYVGEVSVTSDSTSVAST